MVDYQQIQDGRREYICNFHDLPEILLAIVLKLSNTHNINKNTSTLFKKTFVINMVDV